MKKVVLGTMLIVLIVGGFFACQNYRENQIIREEELAKKQSMERKKKLIKFPKASSRTTTQAKISSDFAVLNLRRGLTLVVESIGPADISKGEELSDSEKLSTDKKDGLDSLFKDSTSYDSLAKLINYSTSSTDKETLKTTPSEGTNYTIDSLDLVPAHVNNDDNYTFSIQLTFHPTGYNKSTINLIGTVDSLTGKIVGIDPKFSWL